MRRASKISAPAPVRAANFSARRTGKLRAVLARELVVEERPSLVQGA